MVHHMLHVDEGRPELNQGKLGPRGFWEATSSSQRNQYIEKGDVTNNLGTCVRGWMVGAGQFCRAELLTSLVDDTCEVWS